MNALVFSKITRALAAGVFASIVVACTAQVGTAESPEIEAKIEVAKPIPCSDGEPAVACVSGGALNKNSPFEAGLIALNCAGKTVAEGTGKGKAAVFQTTCPVNSGATFACGQTCGWPVNGDHRVCTTNYVTGNIAKLIQCNEGVAELDATEYPTSSCDCRGHAPSGETYVYWDPTCSSGSCLPKFPN